VQDEGGNEEEQKIKWKKKLGTKDGNTSSSFYYNI